MNGPFVVDVTSASNLLELIHDRTGEAIFTPIKETLPQYHTEKSKYNNYAQAYWNTGVAKYPKFENPNPKVYSTSIDFESADGEKMTPLGKLWTDAERKKNEAKPIVEKTEDSENLEELCELIREHFDFELKFHIITMIPTTSKVPFERETSTRFQFKKYFSNAPRAYCTETVDSVFVTYHKYRAISNTFNTRMQEYLMNRCDSLNIAAIFIRFYSPRTNAIEPENNIDLFLSKYAHLLCFINAKKRYFTKKLGHFEDEGIYQNVRKVYETLKSNWSEMFILKTDTETGAFALNGSISSYRLNYYNNNVDDLDIDVDEDSKKEVKTEEEKEKVEEAKGDEIALDDEEKIDLIEEDESSFLQGEKKEDKEEETQDEEETTEADLVDELNQQSLNNNYMVTNFSRLVTQTERKENVKKRPKGAELALELDSSEIGLDIVNENFDKLDPAEFSRNYFPTGIPRISSEFTLTPHTVAYSPVYTYETYLCALIRLSLRKVLPDLFSEWYEESHKLFKSFSLLNLQGYNFLNNILLHILLENGKTIPKTVDPSLVKGSVCGSQVEEITFVNFVLDNLSFSFSNDRSFYPSPGKLDGLSKDPLAIKTYFHFEELQGYDSVSKNLLRSCFANNVKKIKLAPYGDYVYSLGTEIGYLTTLFPNMKELCILAKSRENSDIPTQMTNIFTSTTSDIESAKDVLKKFYDKFYFLFEGKPQKVIDTCKDGFTNNDDDANQEPPADITGAFTVRPMLDREDERRLVVRGLIVAQLDKDLIGQIPAITEQRLEFLPLLNQLLAQSPGLSISKKREIIDYCIKSNIPYSAIDTYNYEHTEEKRVIEEYLIYHNNKSDESMLHPDSIIYDGNFHWCHVLMYFGLNIFKNAHVLEEFMFSLMVGKCSRVNGYYTDKSTILDLYIAKLFYENGSIDLLTQAMAQIAEFQGMDNLEETLKKVEADSNCTEELSTDKKVRALQIFFRHFTRPKSHPDFEKQKVQLTTDKLIAMLTSCYDDIRMIDNLSTLCTCLGKFREVFGGITFLQSNKSTPDPYSEDLSRNYINYLDSTDEIKHTRQAALIQMIYNGQASIDQPVPAFELDAKNMSFEAPRMVETSVLNLLCASMVRSVPFVITLIENMSAEDLLYRDNNGYTCLTILASQRSGASSEIITAILDKQPKLINIPTLRLMTPLHLVCLDPSNIGLAKLLVTKYGADTNALNDYGLTPYETASLMFLKDLFPSRSVLSGFLKRHHDNMNWLKPKSNLSKKEILKQMVENRKLL